MSGEKKNPKCALAGRDAFVPTGRMSDGSIVGVRHRACGDSEAGVMKILKDGEAIPNVEGGEIAMLRGGGEGPWDVETLYRCGEGSPKGPAKVSTEAYRTGWEGVFGARGGVGEA